MSALSVPVAGEYAVQWRRPHNLTVRITIDHNNSTVSYSPMHDEHLSNYSTRNVIFEADADCTLVLSDPEFFGLSSPSVALYADVPIVLTVPAGMEGDTSYWVEFPLPITNVMYVGKPIVPYVPPKIIFP